MKDAIVTKQSMIESLSTLSDYKIVHYVGRALVAIFLNQTDSEKVVNQTNNNNNIGFSSSDAKDGSITAKYYIKHGTLLGWQLDNWTRDWRGAPRITKYHRQLNEVAIAKKNAPRFKHDAEDHQYAGRNQDGHDVWYNEKFGEIIIRFGDHPEQNRAMRFEQAKSIFTYAEAIELVKQNKSF